MKKDIHWLLNKLPVVGEPVERKLKDIKDEAKKAGGFDSFLENPDATFLADFPGTVCS